MPAALLTVPASSSNRPSYYSSPKRVHDKKDTSERKNREFPSPYHSNNSSSTSLSSDQSAQIFIAQRVSNIVTSRAQDLLVPHVTDLDQLRKASSTRSNLDEFPEPLSEEYTHLTAADIYDASFAIGRPNSCSDNSTFSDISSNSTGGDSPYPPSSIATPDDVESTTTLEKILPNLCPIPMDVPLDLQIRAVKAHLEILEHMATQVQAKSNYTGQQFSSASASSVEEMETSPLDAVTPPASNLLPASAITTDRATDARSPIMHQELQTRCEQTMDDPSLAFEKTGQLNSAEPLTDGAASCPVAPQRKSSLKPSRPAPRSPSTATTSECETTVISRTTSDPTLDTNYELLTDATLLQNAEVKSACGPPDPPPSVQRSEDAASIYVGTKCVQVASPTGYSYKRFGLSARAKSTTQPTRSEQVTRSNTESSSNMIKLELKLLSEATQVANVLSQPSSTSITPVSMHLNQEEIAVTPTIARSQLKDPKMIRQHYENHVKSSSESTLPSQRAKYPSFSELAEQSSTLSMFKPTARRMKAIEIYRDAPVRSQRLAQAEALSTPPPLKLPSSTSAANDKKPPTLTPNKLRRPATSAGLVRSLQPSTKSQPSVFNYGHPQIRGFATYPTPVPTAPKLEVKASSATNRGRLESNPAIDTSPKSFPTPIADKFATNPNLRTNYIQNRAATHCRPTVAGPAIRLDRSSGGGSSSSSESSIGTAPSCPQLARMLMTEPTGQNRRFNSSSNLGGPHRRMGKGHFDSSNGSSGSSTTASSTSRCDRQNSHETKHPFQNLESLTLANDSMDRHGIPLNEPTKKTSSGLQSSAAKAKTKPGFFGVLKMASRSRLELTLLDSEV